MTDNTQHTVQTLTYPNRTRNQHYLSQHAGPARSCSSGTLGSITGGIVIALKPELWLTCTLFQLLRGPTALRNERHSGGISVWWCTVGQLPGLSIAGPNQQVGFFRVSTVQQQSCHCTTGVVYSKTPYRTHLTDLNNLHQALLLLHLMSPRRIHILGPHLLHCPGLLVVITVVTVSRVVMMSLSPNPSTNLFIPRLCNHLSPPIRISLRSNCKSSRRPPPQLFDSTCCIQKNTSPFCNNIHNCEALEPLESFPPWTPPY